jgi:hypothetical protein
MFGHPGAIGRPGLLVHVNVHRGFDRNGGRAGYGYYDGYGLGYAYPDYYPGYYTDPAQGATPVTVISYSGGGYAPSAPAQEVVNSGPRIIIIGAEPKGGPLPRVIYGTAGVE